MATEVPPTARNPLLLTSTQEEILKAVNDLHFVSEREIRFMVFSKGSTSYVRAHLRAMAGGEDWKLGHYLYKFPLPTVRGNRPRIFVLGKAGAAYLRRMGVEVTWWGKFYKVRNYSVSFVHHQLSVAQLLVALHCFCRQNPAHQVTETLTSYDLLRDPPCAKLVTKGQKITVSVLPDAWAYVERVADHQGQALWFEIDNNGTESRKKYLRLLSGRLALLKDGYQDYFGTPVVLLCYVVTGTMTTPEQRVARLHTLRRWTHEFLTQEQLEEWTCVFRFAVVKEDLYSTPLFDASAQWYRPDEDEAGPLFDPIPPMREEPSDGNDAQKY